MNYVNRSLVKQLAKDCGKRLSKDAIDALDNKVISIVRVAAKMCGGLKTITETEILISKGC